MVPPGVRLGVVLTKVRCGNGMIRSFVDNGKESVDRKRVAATHIAVNIMFKSLPVCLVDEFTDSRGIRGIYQDHRPNERSNAREMVAVMVVRKKRPGREKNQVRSNERKIKDAIGYGESSGFRGVKKL